MSADEDAWTEGRPPAPVAAPAVGLLACLPLFAIYEASLFDAAAGWRNTFEMIAMRPFAPLGDALPWARRAAFLVIGLLAFVHVRREGWRLRPSLLRTFLEGLFGAIALGPAIVLAAGLLPEDVPKPPLPRGAEDGLGLETGFVFFHMGSAVWEELIARMLAYGLAYVVAQRALDFLGAPERTAHLSGEVFGVVASSVGFAAMHLEGAVSWFGVGGEPFHLASFAFRTLAGVLLALLFRWRGIGVAAWTHALFNVSVALGVGSGALS